ncbi:Pimeloyl-ACP methyl ester carboxylesterase [Rathayibacter oskolensis]|uniref:Pimeloyl-ACP methyl ester carboxylesterase n=1 Tax=Rathayibacter oskolensis TaxID=1891671 RepID=A0A1X7NWU3_9MICO|nr:alpha/beta hydrolase [Rathayibacter oskolensis]SMH42258.1 Pimeloyl-ACP methyl ester carboxylesterase [Rathayibacter oskolensis]
MDDAAPAFSEYGAGPLFAMLHPGGTDSRALTAIAASFADSYRVLTPDRRGHGRTPDTEAPMTFEGMADETIAFLEEHGTGPSPLLGYSDGAVVALLVAHRRPDLVSQLVFVSGVFSLDGWPAETLDSEVPAFLAEAYAEVSPDGLDHYPVVLEKLRRMHELGPTLTLTDLASIRLPVLVLVGDDDDMPLEHILELYRALPLGELAVVPHASHGVLVEKPRLCHDLIAEFLRPDKPPTFAPVRRSVDV